MSSPDILISMQSAIQAHREGDVSLAKSLYLEVLSEDQEHVQALCNLGVIYKQNGSYSSSLNTFNKAISLDPSNVPSYINLAALYLKIDLFQRALETYDKALHVAPKDANIYNLIAIAYEKNEMFDKAIHFYKEAIRHDVKFVKAYNNIGVLLYKQKRYKAAVEMFQMSRDIDPEFVSTYVNLGAACNKAKMFEEGEKALLKAIKLDDNATGAYANLGNIYNKMKRHDSARINHEMALMLEDTSASNHANIGITYKHLGMYDKAQQALEKAIAINPDFVDAHFDLATTYLLLGKYEKGFTEYEWRFQKHEMQSLFFDMPEILEKPKFEFGLETEGKTLLLYSEQGFGDIIQFARFAEVLKERLPDLKINIQVRAQLHTLISEMSCFDQVLIRGEKVEAFDYQLALMSLPYLLQTSYKTVPNTTPYIKVDGNFDIKIDHEKLNIGVVWGASRTSESYEGRVYSLKQLQPLMDDCEIQLYSLQVAGDVEEIQKLGLSDAEIIDVEEKLTDFKQSALLIEKLDLVITSDTSVAHLAGALGKEAWVMLQKNSEWRWGLDSDKTPWYPGHKLIKQETEGDWNSAFEKVYKLIEERKR